MELVLRSVQRPVAFARRGQTAKGTFATEIGVWGWLPVTGLIFQKILPAFQNYTEISLYHRCHML